jgi:hypothetical protein
MLLSAVDLLRIGLTLLLAVLAYGRLGTLLRFAFPGRVRHRDRPGAGEPAGPAAAALRAVGFRFLGVRGEAIFRIHGRVAAVYAHPDGRVVDLPLSGQLPGAYVMTIFGDGRCALTWVGTGREVAADRYRSGTVGPGATVRDLLATHAEARAAISLGEPARVVGSLADRLALAELWYREHARVELAVPALLDGALLVGLVGLAVYLWTI